MAYGDKQRKSLPPSPKKKREARREGNIPKTPELSQWATLLAATYIYPTFLKVVESRVFGIIATAHGIMAHPDANKALALFKSALASFATLALLVASLLGILTVFITVSQVGFVLATKAAKPNFKRLNIFKGIQGLFSPRALWMGAKTFLKIGLIGLIAFRVIWPMATSVISARPISLGPLLDFTGQRVIVLVREVAVAGLLLAAIDYLITRRRVKQSLMMTKEEAREETRMHEGDPLVKRRIRITQMRLSRMRMIAALAEADVVIANPTHYLVALQYAQETHIAPILVAKGEGELALRLKEEALRLAIPVVEDPPLARALYHSCEVDEMIPHELYVAVARLLAFVYSLSTDARLLGVVFRQPVSAMGV